MFYLDGFLLINGMSIVTPFAVRYSMQNKKGKEKRHILNVTEYDMARFLQSV